MFRTPNSTRRLINCSAAIWSDFTNSMEVSWLPRELWLCALGDSGTNVTAA